MGYSNEWDVGEIDIKEVYLTFINRFVLLNIISFLFKRIFYVVLILLILRVSIFDCDVSP